MKGRRIYPADSSLGGVIPGDYWKDSKGVWFTACPIELDDGILLAGLALHDIIEHEDGTITVHPSILVGGNYSGIASHEWVDRHTWHGFLERGIWRDA